MKKKYLLFTVFAFLLSTPVSLVALPALAQDSDNEDGNARIEKLERDLNTIQRQISRSSGSAARSGGNGTGTANADFEVRLSAIEEQMRKLLGKTEENDFKVKKLTENLDKLQRDSDFRFNEITKAQAAAQTVAQLATPAKEAAEKTPAKKDKAAKTTDKTADVIIVDDNETHTETDAKTADKNTDDKGAVKSDFATPRDHYNYAFRLLNQTQYDKSSAAFEDFTKKHPQDQLVGNAYYWLGETFYIRRDYVSAADSFRQGFEALPNGPKAPDNLLKLAMSLNALKRDKEACVVLGQIVTKFKKTATAVSQKAETERKRIACE